MMPDKNAPAVTEEILAQLRAFEIELKECRHDLIAAKASMVWLVTMNAEMDMKLARVESDVARIRRHLDALPDDALTGHQR